jgi:hypothetical protein
MRWLLVFRVLLGLLIMQQAPSQDASEADKSKSTKPVPSSLLPYYDRRERVASSLTFEWQTQTLQTFSVEMLKGLAWIGRSGEDAASDSSTLEASELNLELAGLQGVCRIERTPEITRVYRREEIACGTKAAR